MIHYEEVESDEEMARDDRRMILAVFGLIAIIFASVILFDFFGDSPKKKPFILEVVTTPAEMAKGLAGRKSMPMDRAMMFVWNDAKVRCLWAKDMEFDLDIAFFDAAGKVLNFDQMKAGTTNPHCSEAPAKFALEANKGTILGD